MKKKNYLILILIVSIIGFASVFYLKFIKTYTDEKFQIQTTNDILKQPTLGETIAFMKATEAITDSNGIISTENDKALKMLMRINLMLIITMSISVIVAIWSTKKLLPKSKSIRL